MCRLVNLAHEMKSHDDNRVNLLVSRKQQTPVIRRFFPILRSSHRLTHTYLLYFTILIQLVSFLILNNFLLNSHCHYSNMSGNPAPRRQPQANRTPYTKVLSALLKTELLRLCLEFHLPTDGSVVALRLRLKDYLNLNRDTLYRNPRYNALFPRHRRVINHLPPPLLIQPLPLSHTRSTSSSSILSYKSSSPALSYGSWNGIEDQPVHPQQHVPAPQLLPPQQPPPPHEPHAHHSPPPSPSNYGSDHDFPPPAVHAAIGRKSYPPIIGSLSLSTCTCRVIHGITMGFFPLDAVYSVPGHYEVPFPRDTM
jgi:hypothetical protein